MTDSEKNIPLGKAPSEEGHSLFEEEYNFNEDAMDLHSLDSSQPQPTSEQPAAAEPKKSMSFEGVLKIFDTIQIKPLLDILKQNFAVRIGLIVFFVILLVAIIYRCSSDPLSKKVVEKIPSIPVTHAQSQTKEVVISRVPAVTMGPKKASMANEPAISQDQFSRLERVNSDLQAQIRELSGQMTSVRSNADTTAASLRMVADQLAQLAVTVANESKVSAGLVEQLKQQKKPFGFRKMKMPSQQVNCVLQAIIPGRAWLICSNGETVTVSQGTRIGDYGIVRYIDAPNERVLTSSGQTITFGQEDS